MPKDYVRKPVNKSSNSGLKSLLRTIVSFFCGYFLATLFDFATLKEWVARNLPGKADGKASHKIVKQNELPKPKFEFYTLLTKSENAPLPVAAPVPVETETPLRAQQPLAVENKTLASSGKEAYFVQIASFRSRQEAERLKASLILKGFDANISIALQQQTNWFRVAVGPFNSRSEAEKAQLALTKIEHVKSMIRKVG